MHVVVSIFMLKSKSFKDFGLDFSQFKIIYEERSTTTMTVGGDK